MTGKIDLKCVLKKSDKNTIKNVLKTAIMIVAGSAIYGTSISLFLSPNHLASGGVSGISIMINYLTQIPTGIFIFCLNIPLMLVGLWQLGAKFSVLTLIAVFLTSRFTDLLSGFPALTDNTLLAAIIGGVVSAVGIGIVFKAGSTTGGTDIIVRIIRKKYKHLRSGEIFMCIDLVIVGISAIVYNNIEAALYAAISLYISSVTLDKVLYGADGAKMVYIITNRDKQDEIANRILEELDIGVTFVKGSGAYSGKDRKIIMCVMRKSRLPKVREIVEAADETSFMVVSPATEIFGEGYKRYDAEEL